MSANGGDICICRHYERLGLPMLLLFLSKDGDDPIALPTKAEREAR